MISYTRFIDTPIGKILVSTDEESLTGLYFPSQLESTKPRSRFQARPQMSPTIRAMEIFQETEAQVNQYFKGERTNFELPLNLNGTEFQKKVWGQLQKIPFGATISYKELATRVGNPKASRAVGMANSKNPISLIVPCHRVIGENGSLTGYAGGLSTKEYLLRLEGAKNN